MHVSRHLTARRIASFCRIGLWLAFALTFSACKSQFGNAGLVGGVVPAAVFPVLVTEVIPASGIAAGGNTITIRGEGFVEGSTARLGATPCTSTEFVSSSELRCTVPPGTPGDATVTVVLPDQRSDTLSPGYRYVAPPLITSVLPLSGPTSGGTVVTITGSNFDPAIAISIASLCASVTWLSSTSCRCVTPAASAGSYRARVTNTDGQFADSSDLFTFYAPPAPTKISPSSGPTAGGTALTISGSGFRSGLGVVLGGTAATVGSVSDTQIAVTSPPHAAGAVDVVVQNSDGQSATLVGAFTYIAPPPTLTKISPTVGSTAGGTDVTLTGTGFATGATVSFGASAATNVIVASATSITAKSPAGALGAPVDVAVTNPDTQQATLPAAFRYQDPPILTSISPTSGATCGDNRITMQVSNVLPGFTVTIGGVPCDFRVVLGLPQTIVCRVPPHAAGTVDVTVTNPNGLSATLPAAYTYSVAPPNGWFSIASLGAPSPRLNHTVVWTGSRALVWGGNDGDGAFGDGAAYDPVTDSWTPISGTGAPSARYFHTAAWTGSVMVVFGGVNVTKTGGVVSGTSQSSDGGRYDPVLDTWQPVTAVGSPGGGPLSNRPYLASTWTGSRVVVYNGTTTTIASYDPDLDVWTGGSATGIPTTRYSFVSVWSGSELIVWGGLPTFGGAFLTDGARYNPLADTWSPMTATAVPNDLSYPGASWSGSEMLVWGGIFGTASLRVGRYNPVTDTWTRGTSAGAPFARYYPRVVWDGTSLLVAGGGDNLFVKDNDVHLYDPVADNWSLAPPCGPLPSNGQTIRTTNEIFIWGGEDLWGAPRSGGRYNPATSTWQPMTTSNAPLGRWRNCVTWTGSEMMVFGGELSTAGFNLNPTNTGGLYDPITDTWRATSTLNAPDPNFPSALVWTGTRAIAWGGIYGGAGGSYDPVTDTWTAISITNQPSKRGGFTMTWTGTEAAVYGDFGEADQAVSLYNPATDTWRTSTLTNAPSGRSEHTTVWTGSRLISFGGGADRVARYNPSTDTWEPMSLVGAPAARSRHVSVWTGTHVVVWGGNAAGGGRYDPVSDTWLPLSTVGAPPVMSYSTAVWSGARMIVFGGTPFVSFDVNSSVGGEYDPVGDAWTLTPAPGAYLGRSRPSSVWTGSRFIVWGGRNPVFEDRSFRFSP